MKHVWILFVVVGCGSSDAPSCDRYIEMESCAAPASLKDKERGGARGMCEMAGAKRGESGDGAALARVQNAGIRFAMRCAETANSCDAYQQCKDRWLTSDEFKKLAGAL